MSRRASSRLTVPDHSARFRTEKVQKFRSGTTWIPNAVLLSSPSARAGDEYGWRFGAVTVDVFIARPFTFFASLFGGALWAVSLPITAPTKTSQDAFDALVRTPWDLTFDRELGDYSGN